MSEWKDPINHRATAPFFAAMTLACAACVYGVAYYALTIRGILGAVVLACAAVMGRTTCRFAIRTWTEATRTK